MWQALGIAICIFFPICCKSHTSNNTKIKKNTIQKYTIAESACILSPIVVYTVQGFFYADLKNTWCWQEEEKKKAGCGFSLSSEQNENPHARGLTAI